MERMTKKKIALEAMDEVSTEHCKTNEVKKKKKKVTALSSLLDTRYSFK